MWIFQSITLFGVKEDRTNLEKSERTTLKDLWRALVGNDQLLVTAVSMALFMIGYCTTTAFGTYYFKYAYKDEGMYMVFAAVLAVAQLTALSVFPLFRKKFTRKQRDGSQAACHSPGKQRYADSLQAHLPVPFTLRVVLRPRFSAVPLLRSGVWRNGDVLLCGGVLSRRILRV